MKITAKSEYGLRAMIELAINYNKDALKSSDIAKRQAIPISFLENLLNTLKKSKLIISKRGRLGGYSLSKPPEQINIAEIIEILDGEIMQMPIEKSSLNELWEIVQKTLVDKLSGISLDGLVNSFLIKKKILTYNI